MIKTITAKVTSQSGATATASTTIEVFPQAPVTTPVFVTGNLSFTSDIPAKTYYRYTSNGVWTLCTAPFTPTGDLEYYSVSDASASMGDVRQWTLPPAIPTGGRYQTAQTITLNLEGTIIYTLDGSDPRHYIPTNDGKAVFDESGVLVLTDEPYAPDI